MLAMSMRFQIKSNVAFQNSECVVKIQSVLAQIAAALVFVPFQLHAGLLDSYLL
jgi:hypothetical protein